MSCIWIYFKLNVIIVKQNKCFSYYSFSSKKYKTAGEKRGYYYYFYESKIVSAKFVVINGVDVKSF